MAKPFKISQNGGAAVHVDDCATRCDPDENFRIELRKELGVDLHQLSFNHHDANFKDFIPALKKAQMSTVAHAL